MKYLFVFSCVGLFPLLGHAQTSDHVRLGVTAGGTLTTIVGNGLPGEGIPDTPAIKGRAGWTGGVIAQLPLTNQGTLFLQPELVYNQEGYRLESSYTDYSAKRGRSFVSLPVMLGYTKYGFFVTAGPQIGYLAAVRDRYHFPSYTLPDGTIKPAYDETGKLIRHSYNRWETSVVAALGYRLANGFGLEARYTEALTSMEGGSVFKNNRHSRNAGGQLRISYLLR